MPNLINSSSDLKANFSSLSLNFTWANISSFEDDVERDIISEAIGPDALAWFQNNLTAELTTVQANALKYLQRCAAYLTINKWTETALFQFEDKALYLAKTTTGAIPSDKKLTDLRRLCSEDGFKFLDKAIDLMENNLASFATYADSGTRQTLNQGFIKTAIDFSRQRNINNSRLTFLSMFYFMLDLQDEKLTEVMTPAYYALFKERYLDDELSPDEIKLLPFIKKAIAMFTVAQACTQLPVQITNGGFYVNRFNNSIDYQMKDAADQGRLQFMADDHCEKGERYLLQLGNYIVANANDLPGYVAPPADVDPGSCNRKENGFYSFP